MQAGVSMNHTVLSDVVVGYETIIALVMTRARIIVHRTSKQYIVLQRTRYKDARGVSQVYA